MPIINSQNVFSAIIFLFIVFLSFSGFFDLEFAAVIVPFIFLCYLIITKHWQWIHCAVLFFILNLSDVYSIFWISDLPAVGLLLIIVVSTFVILPFKSIRNSLTWFRFGRIDRVALSAILVIGLLSAIALLQWATWSNNLGAARSMILGFSAYPKWLVLVFGVPLFACVNAVVEEFIYRGVLQEALLRTFKSPIFINILQASAFAALHFKSGFPNGKAGYVMVLIYGIALGYIRIRTTGLLAPYLAHILADSVIGFFMTLRFL